MDRVVLESRHKFVYYDDKSIEYLRKLENEYFPKINSSEPVVIYIKDGGLPKMNSFLKSDDYIVNVFYERYYELLIFSSIIDTLINYIDIKELNVRLKMIFRMFSYISKSKIEDVYALKETLIYSINMFKNGYIKYMKTGKLDFYDKVPIPFIMLDNVLSDLKKFLGFDKCFSLMLEFEGDISKYSNKAINNYIASRCNGYLSMNVLLQDDSDWKCWYANNGQFIEYIHDYTVVDFRKNKTLSRNIQK